MAIKLVDLTEAMSDLMNALDHLQRVLDCLEGGKETDIDHDLEQARDLAFAASRLINNVLQRDNHGNH